MSKKWTCFTHWIENKWQIWLKKLKTVTILRIGENNMIISERKYRADMAANWREGRNQGARDANEQHEFCYSLINNTGQWNPKPHFKTDWESSYRIANEANIHLQKERDEYKSSYEKAKESEQTWFDAYCEVQGIKDKSEMPSAIHHSIRRERETAKDRDEYKRKYEELQKSYEFEKEVWRLHNSCTKINVKTSKPPTPKTMYEMPTNFNIDKPDHVKTVYVLEDFDDIDFSDFTYPKATNKKAIEISALRQISNHRGNFSKSTIEYIDRKLKELGWEE